MTESNENTEGIVSGEDYSYVDATATPLHETTGGMGPEASQDELNPAFAPNPDRDPTIDGQLASGAAIGGPKEYDEEGNLVNNGKAAPAEPHEGGDEVTEGEAAGEPQFVGAGAQGAEPPSQDFDSGVSPAEDNEQVMAERKAADEAAAEENQAAMQAKIDATAQQQAQAEADNQAIVDANAGVVVDEGQGEDEDEA